MISFRLRLVAVIVALIVISSLAGITFARPAAVTPVPQGDGARRIKPEDARELLDKNQAVLVDVRGVDSYKASHIKGALNIPYSDIRARAKELPGDKMIITYCSWPAEHTSAGAVLTLKDMGITNAAAVLGGYDGMVKAGFATEAVKQ